MSDRQKHIPTPPPSSDWDGSAGFRANFLHRFTQPKDHAALSRLSDMLYEYALEFARHWPDDGASPTRAELRRRRHRPLPPRRLPPLHRPTRRS